MKAVQISEVGGPEVLQVIDLPMPVLKPGEVLVKTHAIGVALPDVLLRTGRYPWMPALPYVLGNEVTGHVVDANGSALLQQGQPVFFTSWDMGFAGGLYAEYVAVNELVPWELPAGVDLDEAAGLFNYIVAWLLLHHGARGAQTDAVLLHGASGGMGTALTDLCKLAGSTVFGTAGTDAKCQFVRARGADHAINYNDGPVPDKVLELTGGRGVDIVFNHLAGDSFTNDMRMLAPLGLVVSYGALEGMPETDLFRTMRANIDRSPSLRVIGTHVFNQTPQVRDAACEAVIDLLTNRRISPAITTRLPLSEAANAHRMIESRESIGKILLKP